MRTSLLIFTLMISAAVNSQKGKNAHYFDNPIVIDSNSTIIIPTRYSSDFISTNKIALWGDYYANIIFYNFVTDSSKKLFENDVYIVSFTRYHYYYQPRDKTTKTSKHIFYRVKNFDRTKNGRIDNADPSILYVSDLQGNNLKALTSQHENVVSIDVFEKQNFALVKVQRDEDNDFEFGNDDKDFYYIKLDLQTLTFGNKIETR